MTFLKSIALVGALAAITACQPATTTTTQTAPPANTQAWEHWYVDANGLTKTITDTTDWQTGRVGGPNGTTLVVECNGNDPTAFEVWIEHGQPAKGDYPPMAKPYDIEVFSRGNRIFAQAWRAENRNGAFIHTATTDFASAMRQGSYMVFKFQDAEPHRYTLKGSARVIDQLSCDPNLL